MIIGGKEVWTERKTKAVMPHGTTTVIADPHEIVNVKGNEAMEYIWMQQAMPHLESMS